MDKLSYGGDPSGAAQADWAIMLYIAADNTLANFAVESLKQLNKSARAPAESTDARVVVAAHFAFPADASKPESANAEAPDGYDTRDYVFKEVQGERPVRAQVHTLPKPVEHPNKADMASKTRLSEQQALKQFLDWAHKECNAKRYALILWGHGPELLLQPVAGSSTGERNNLYLTPVQLSEALTEWKNDNRTKLDIIGFDACSMSMFEMAYELKDLAGYMVASQSDVPDLSFPYDNLIELFREHGNEPEPKSLLEKGVAAYDSTYKDCICNQSTEMKPVTLTVLDLKQCDKLKDAVSSLAYALSNAKDNPDLKDQPRLADLLIEARKSSQDFAGGLYVDLHDFCTKLQLQLANTKQEYRDKIQGACTGVLGALNKDTSKLILKNSDDERGHGVSIYLPYLTNKQYAQVSKPLVKGGEVLHGVKGYSDMLNGAATEYLMCARRNLILETETYYGRLKFADTHWYDFIAGQWTRALMEKVPSQLDYHYSAQQSWMNVTRATVDPPPPPPPEASVSETSASPEHEMCAAQ